MEKFGFYIQTFFSRDLNLSKIDKNKNLIFIDNEWETRIKDRKSRDNSLIELVKNDNNKKYKFILYRFPKIHYKFLRSMWNNKTH